MKNLLEELDKIGAETDDAVERFVNDEEMYLKYVVDFPNDPTMPSLKKAVEDKDYDAAEKFVHSLKGITANLGFLPLNDASVDMLEELRDHNVPAALKAFEMLENQYEMFCNVINGCK